MTSFRKSVFKVAVGLALFSAFISPSHGVVSHNGLRPDQTPLILKTFYSQVETFKKEYKTEDLKNFWFDFKENADQALAEILVSVAQVNPTADTSQLVLEEFKKLQISMTHRGYEPSQNLYWAPPKQLVISYDPEAVGAKPYPGFADTPLEGYTHSLQYEQRLNYQPKGKVLKAHQRYPRLVLKGAFILECKTPLAGCRVLMTTIDEAGIRWERVPGFKGGNSSAGQ